MDKTINLNLPYIQPAQAQKHVTHNEAIRALDAVVHISVVDRDLSAPPDNPAEGDRYLIAARASGDWAGHDESLAAYQDGAWQLFTPRDGWLVWVQDEETLLVRAGAQWRSIDRGTSVPQFGVNTTPDANNRLAVKAENVLFSHDDVTPGGSGNSRVTVNKRRTSNSASVVFQNNWIGRAEIGLTGNNALSVRVSANGVNFHDAMVVQAEHVAYNVPIRLPSYVVQTRPNAATAGRGAMILSWYTDTSRAPVPAYSDGSTWRSLMDNNPVT